MATAAALATIPLAAIAAPAIADTLPGVNPVDNNWNNNDPRWHHHRNGPGNWAPQNLTPPWQQQQQQQQQQQPLGLQQLLPQNQQSQTTDPLQSLLGSLNLGQLSQSA
ncbi:hypothetical protein FOS14_09245 [Skermania sp. ID1734]|uniref:hypothetical protein n=1 Tax=Skermania sp. ID1734 TaxID=2597516 RepID=UPI00117F1CF9|nr:hypothetical protein [Skermania sp. ID1734]TSE00002.1 hypothetical protein FOS14_09245 [Skermania sp. ID1734]